MKENFTFEEVVNLIETHIVDNDRPWADWVSEKYCNDCSAIVTKEKYYDREIDVTHSYCELHDECRYFGHVMTERELIEMWLEHLTTTSTDTYLMKEELNQNDT